MTRLHLRYSDGESSKYPASLMLKIVQTEPGEFGPSEVDYYSKDYVNLQDAPLLPCYDAAYDGEAHVYHLLLADVSDTHTVNWQRTPTLAYGRTLAEALAILHVHWWGVERLQEAGILWPDRDQIDRHIAIVSEGLAPLLDLTQGEIPSEWASTLPQILDRHPEAMHNRMMADDHFTLIHGDANPGNTLSPIDGETPIYLIDRQPFDWSFTTWLGVFDLAYQMGLWWDTAVRRRLEIKVLGHYHTALTSRGIRGYSWEQLLSDYKLCLLQQIYVPLAWCEDSEEREKMKWVWLPQLKKAMTAIFDLECMKLLRNKGTQGTQRN